MSEETKPKRGRRPDKMKRQKFVSKVLEGKTATDAYLETFDTNNRRTAAPQASRLMKLPAIRDEVAARINKNLESAEVIVGEIIGGAVRQSRGSIDDVLDENGSFDLNKARETGAIDFIKKHKETTRYDKEGNATRIVEVEMLTNQEGRKELADLMSKATALKNDERVSVMKIALGAAFSALQQKKTFDEVYDSIKPRLTQTEIELLESELRGLLACSNDV